LSTSVEDVVRRIARKLTEFLKSGSAKDRGMCGTCDGMLIDLDHGTSPALMVRPGGSSSNQSLQHRLARNKLTRQRAAGRNKEMPPAAAAQPRCVVDGYIAVSLLQPAGIVQWQCYVHCLPGQECVDQR
jgi:hypothetical protein